MIRILQQIYYLERFWKILRYFLEKRIYLFWKNPKFWTFWEILLFQSHSTANLLLQRFLKNSRVFSQKTHLFFLKKNPNFERFEKFYCFSRILRQICYNLMKKNWHSNTWTRVGSFTRAQLANIGEKERTYLRGRFCFPYFQHGAK